MALAEPVDTVVINGCGGRNPDFFGELPKAEGVLWQSYKNLPNTAGIQGKYISLCYLGNGERGFSVIPRPRASTSHGSLYRSRAPAPVTVTSVPPCRTHFTRPC